MTDIEQKISEIVRTLPDEYQLKVLEFAKSVFKQNEAETEKESE